MTTYRVYLIDPQTDHIVGPPKVIECADDNEAREAAKQYIDGKDIELWEGPRFIVRIPHQE